MYRSGFDNGRLGPIIDRRGRAGFEECLDNAMDGLDFCLGTVRASFSPKEVMAWAKDFLAGLRDTDLRAFYLPRLAFGLGIDEAAFRGAASKTAAPHGSPGAHPTH